MQNLIFVDGGGMIGPGVVFHHVPAANRPHIGIVRIMIQIRQIQRMSHLMAEDIRGKVSRRTFKFQIEGVRANAIDGHHIVERIMREILHVGPQNGCPSTCAAFHDEADVIDVTVAIAVQHNAGVHQMQRVHIPHDTAQQQRLAH